MTLSAVLSRVANLLHYSVFLCLGVGFLFDIDGLVVASAGFAVASFCCFAVMPTLSTSSSPLRNFHVQHLWLSEFNPDFDTRIGFDTVKRKLRTQFQWAIETGILLAFGLIVVFHLYHKIIGADAGDRSKVLLALFGLRAANRFVWAFITFFRMGMGSLKHSLRLYNKLLKDVSFRSWITELRWVRTLHYFQKQKFDNVVEEVSRLEKDSLDLQPATVALFLRFKAEALFRLERYQECVDCLDRYLTAEPDDTEANKLRREADLRQIPGR